MSRRNPFVQLFLARMREFMREPGVLFWVFGFPILLAIGLGVAFRNKAPDVVAVAVIDGAGSEPVLKALTPAAGFHTEVATPEKAREHLRLGRVSIVVVPGATYEYQFDPTRPESVLARKSVHDALENAAGRTDPVQTREVLVNEPGSRYIDFLIPGLLGMNIMSGGMWGVGYAMVEMRSRKLLKRLRATPMRRRDFLGAIIATRMVVVFAEVLLMLGFGWLVFDLVLRGSLFLVTLLSLLGALSFSALGLAVASRTSKTEVVSGLMNLAMLPMFVLSGVFFSSDRFPDALQPFVRALPLTALNDSLRAVILEGEPLSAQLGRIIVLLAWGAVSFLLALRFFRWN
jgi:ABC transporter DrrB family efflux protein